MIMWLIAVVSTVIGIVSWKMFRTKDIRLPVEKRRDIFTKMLEK